MRPHPSKRHQITPEIPYKFSHADTVVGSGHGTDAVDPSGPSRLVLFPDGSTRRSVLKAGAIGGAALAVLGLTPTVADADDVTPSITEGPYFKPNSPLRTDLRTPGVVGVFLDLTGVVTDTNGNPVANALLDFWHADMNGNYSTAVNSDPALLTGYELRGHQYTNAQGVYTLQTIVPGHYTGRSLHIHVKAQAPSATLLTTQLFFPNGTTFYNLNLTQLNASDNLFNAACVVALTDVSTQAGFPYVTGTFHFVVPTTSLPSTTNTNTNTNTNARPSRSQVRRRAAARAARRR